MPKNSKKEIQNKDKAMPALIIKRLAIYDYLRNHNLTLEEIKFLLCDQFLDF